MLDEDRYWVDEDDSYIDYGESMLSYNPDSSGTYYLLLYAFEDYEPESMSIDFDLSTSSEVASSGIFGSISFDQTVFGTLSSGAHDEWEFYGYAGDTVLIAMESSDFDTYLYLHDPYGDEVAYDDDGGGNRDSLIEYTLQSTGYFTILASSYGSSGSGDYALSLEETDAVVDDPSGGYNYAGFMEYGDTVYPYLYEGNEDGWEFYGTAGTIVNIFMYSEDFDCVLELLNPNGVEVAYDDDGGGNLDSYIEGFELQSTGYYTIIARGLASRGSGDYELSLWISDEVAEEPVGQEGYIDLGDYITGDLATGAQDYWYFSGTEGDIITIFLGSDEFDTYLEVWDDTGYQLTYNDDGGGDGDSLVWAYTLPETAYYTIVARSYGNSSGGEYYLYVGEQTFPTIGNLDYGDYIYSTLSSGERLIWTFDGNSGDQVTISLESDDFDTYLELRDEDGNVLITNDDGGDGTSSLINSYTLPSTDTYMIVVRAYSASAEGDFYLTLYED
jgi:hypothetical protein